MAVYTTQGLSDLVAGAARGIAATRLTLACEHLERAVQDSDRSRILQCSGDLLAAAGAVERAIAADLAAAVN